MNSLEAKHQAAQWFAELNDSEVTAEQWERFEEWLNASDGNLVAYEEIQETCDLAVRMRRQQIALTINAERCIASGLTAVRAGERPAWFWRTLVRVAVIAVCVAIFVFAYELGWRSADSGRFETNVGQHLEAHLRDGSTAILNTDTLIVARPSNTGRSVELVRGEALFKVRHDQRETFELTVGNLVVQDLGTQFAVRRYSPYAAEVLIIEGRVRILPSLKVVGPTGNSHPSIAPVELSAGSLWRVYRDGSGEQHSTVVSVAPGEAERRLAWIESRLRFDGQSLAEAVSEYNRYTRSKMIISDPAITKMPVGGDFSTNDQLGFLAAIEHLFHVQITHIGPPDGGTYFIGRRSHSDVTRPTR